MITRTEPVINEGGSYSVMDACRALGCNRRTLHRYADHFRVTGKMNPVNGRIYYKGRDLMKIWRGAF